MSHNKSQSRSWSLILGVEPESGVLNFLTLESESHKKTRTLHPCSEVAQSLLVILATYLLKLYPLKKWKTVEQWHSQVSVWSLTEALWSTRPLQEDRSTRVNNLPQVIDRKITSTMSYWCLNEIRRQIVITQATIWLAGWKTRPTYVMIERIFTLALSTSTVARGASLDLTGVRHHWQFTHVFRCLSHVHHTMQLHTQLADTGICN